MHSCDSCGAANPPGFRFCGACGAPLDTVTCPACSVANPVGLRFCGHCGAALTGGGPSPVTAVHERKLASVLFADVVGFTTLAEGRDPELVARTVDGAFRRLTEIVAEHGGTVDKYMGDCVMAVFGVPHAHDDDAERAVAAGLAMREAGGELALSIGINSGEVMATTVGREGDVTVIGDTVNVAARLEKAAGPGEVLVGALTAELAGGRVVFRERRTVLLAGRREPVHVWEAVAVRSLVGDHRGRLEGPPLVGRDDELAFLRAQWRRARDAGRGGVVLVTGEAGAGKTRLIDELAAAIDDEGLVVRAAYPAYGGMGGPRVAADVIRQLGSSGEPEVDARVRSIAGEYHPSLRSIDQSAIRQEQVWALRRLLEVKAADRPVLVAIDDIHRAAGSMLDLLSELMARSADVPLLLVLAGRPEPADWLARFPAATTVRVGPLGPADAAALANALAGDLPLAPAAATFLAERAGGNPLYLRELVAVGRSGGSLVADDGALILAGRDPVPATLQAVLAARLDHLEPAQKLALQHVAVLGDDATDERVEALGMPEAAPVLRSLVDAGLLRRRAGGHEVADPLLREVAYETLPRDVRGERHRVAAATAPGIEERARHLDRAVAYLPDDPALADDAVAALVRAGTALLDALRTADAARLLERAVELGYRDPATLLALANAEMEMGDEDGALRVLALMAPASDDTALDVERDHIVANARAWSDPERAAAELTRVADRWHELGVPAKEAWAHANAGVALFNLSRMEEAAAALERGLALFERTGERSGAVAAASFLCLVRPTDRRVAGWLADALAFADETGDRSKQLTTLLTLAWHHYFRSVFGSAADATEAEGFAARLAALGAGLVAGDLAAQGECLQASLARLGGRVEEALAHAEAAARLQATQAHRDSSLVQAAGFVAAVAAGAADQAVPFPPDTSPDPVVVVAGILVEIELALAGRAGEALARFGSRAWADLGPVGDLMGIAAALALVLDGRGGEAVAYAERAERSAAALGAEPARRAAVALSAEATGDVARLGPPPARVEGLADALTLRARASLGDTDALEPLRHAASALRMPGLLAGLGPKLIASD